MSEPFSNGALMQSSLTIVLSVAITVAAYFLKRFVDSVQTLTDTVNRLQVRVSVIEATSGIQSPGNVGEYQPPMVAPRRLFSRHREG